MFDSKVILSHRLGYWFVNLYREVKVAVAKHSHTEGPS
jgi:hypothetical protein